MSFYVTTPIYYPNGEPHLGHVYTTLCADVIAIYHRLAGEQTMFLTGTDEHGIKMVKSSADEGIEPRTLADKNAAVFETVWKDLGITNDDFIRTSSDRHKAGATAFVQKLIDKGDIYLGGYEGWYDEGQEEFVTETTAKDNEYKSTISGKPLVRYSEPTYFFRLSNYVPKVLAAIENGQFRVEPESRRNEVVSKLKQGVEDLSISRSSLKWGIPLPHDPEHVLYVWIDALSNYVTALGYPDGDKLKKFWPADVHLIGKEILWFHAVYWPAMLMAAELPLPKVIFAHGWWTSDGRKMGKSLGNFIDLPRIRDVIQKYSLDALRFYMLRAVPFGNDLDWKDAELANAYSELGNVVGNLLNRTLNMTAKYRDGIVPAVATPVDDASLAPALNGMELAIAGAYESLELQRAALLPIELARAANTYIDQTRPFTLAKDPAKAGELDTVLNRCIQAIYKSLVALLPICPQRAAAGLKQLNVETDGKTLGQLLSSELPAGHKLGTAEVLFPRIEPTTTVATQGAV
ncbi:MAG: methionyl-tRNA synthetase [Phycisphaerales bacterium]|nr:methionyl-tRNA synthetase [Phycisphaerales bacterium]